MDDLPDDVDWPNTRLETTYSEARTVLDRQYEDLSDIDDTAMRTVRITALILGALVSIVELSGVSNGGTPYNTEFAVLSGIFFLLSLSAGVLTYNLSSNIITGPSEEYIQRLSENDFQSTTWGRDLINECSNWIESNDTVIDYNSSALFVTHALLIFGLFFAGISVADGLNMLNWGRIFGITTFIVVVVLVVGFGQKGN